MSIQFSCACGKKISAKDEHAGKKGKCPACGGVITVPMPATAAVGSARATAPKATAPPVEDDMYDIREDAPRSQDDDFGIGEAVTPMPYNPTSRPTVSAASSSPASAPAAGGAPMLGGYGRRAQVQQQPKGKLGGLTANFALSGYALFFVCAAVIIPIVFFVIRQGPVKAVAQWDKAEVDGENDVRSTMMYIIAKMDEATMEPRDPNEELDGIPYNPQVEKFLFVDPPHIMWRMPDTVEFEGDTSFGPYSGNYHTRTREVIGEMEWKNGDKLKVVSTCDEQGNVKTCTVDGINVADTAAVKKKWD